MSRRPEIGHPAPSFGLPTGDGDGPRVWSLDAELARDRAVVLIFHRHIH